MQELFNFQWTGLHYSYVFSTLKPKDSKKQHASSCEPHWHAVISTRHEHVHVPVLVPKHAWIRQTDRSTLITIFFIKVHTHARCSWEDTSEAMKEISTKLCVMCLMSDGGILYSSKRREGRRGKAVAKNVARRPKCPNLFLSTRNIKPSTSFFPFDIQCTWTSKVGGCGCQIL